MGCKIISSFLRNEVPQKKKKKKLSAFIDKIVHLT